MEPVEALAEVLGVPVSGIEPVARVDAGYGNRSERLRVGADQFVVRVGAGAEHLPGIDRIAECIALAAVKPWSLGPDVTHCDPTTGLLITRYLDGQRWTAAHFDEPSHLDRLAERLSVLHRVPLPPGMRRLHLDAHVAMLELRVQNPSAHVRDAAQRMLRRLGDPAAVLCHNDVHAGNVIDDGHLRLLDWEYAAIGDADFDLAAPVCYHRLDAAARERFLRRYEAAGRAVNRRRFAAATWLFDYVTCLWELALPRTFEPSAAVPVVSMQRSIVERLRDLESRVENDSNYLT